MLSQEAAEDPPTLRLRIRELAHLGEGQKPRSLSGDQGTAFTSKELQEWACQLGELKAEVLAKPGALQTLSSGVCETRGRLGTVSNGLEILPTK